MGLIRTFNCKYLNELNEMKHYIDVHHHGSNLFVLSG